MIDEVGNIIQDGGGVNPKACQQCKKPFDATIQVTEIKQVVPHYKCSQCGFENSGASAALDHFISTQHTVNKIQKERVVGVENTLKGLSSHVKVTENGILVRCQHCKDW